MFAVLTGQVGFGLGHEPTGQGIVREPVGRYLLEDQGITQVAQEPRQTIWMKASLGSQFINMAVFATQQFRDIGLAGDQQRGFIVIL